MRILLVMVLMTMTTLAYADNNEGCKGNCPKGGGSGDSTAIAGAAAASLAGSLALSGGGDADVQVIDGDTLVDSGDVFVDPSDVLVEANDESTTTNINNTDYRIPAHADAGVAFAMMSGCYGIGGADARGSGSQSAGGLTLNIFKLTNDRCVLAAKALEAQANGNLEGYATMTCADSATWKAYRTVLSAKANRNYFNRISKNDSINACVIEVKAVALAMSVRITQVEATLNEITQMQAEGYDDEEIRRRLGILEDVAHRPNEALLLKDH